MPRSRIIGAIPPLSLHAFMTWTGTRYNSLRKMPETFELLYVHNQIIVFHNCSFFRHTCLTVGHTYCNSGSVVPTITVVVMQHTEQLTQSTLSNSSTLLTPRYVSIYKPISKININIIHHGIHSDNFFSGATINSDNKLLLITINGKFKQLHLYKNIYLLLFKIMDLAREGNFQISEILKLIQPHICGFSCVFYFGIL